MISGLYLSATGVLINSYRQDVIANNIANAETVGFKRDLALFQERPTEAQESGAPQSETNQMLEKLGGGILASPTAVDDSQGELEPGGLFDVGIQGKGFFAIGDPAGQRLTRDGRFSVNNAGHVVLASSGRDVLSSAGKPIQVDPTQVVQFRNSGAVYQNNALVDHIGLFDVSNHAALRKEGGTLLSIGNNTLQPGTGEMHPGFTERANVDPATELTQLMDAQRQLEANANMIRYQDETLSRLVNDVGKIS